MGCDFYIHNILEIEHKNGISYYELPMRRGYYWELDNEYYDSDYDAEENNDNDKLELYNKIYDMMKEYLLTSKKPIIIYRNNSFVTKKLETKYLPFIYNKLNKIYVEDYCMYEDTGTFTEMSEIIRITKKEIRYEPENCDGHKLILYNVQSSVIDSDDDEYGDENKYSLREKLQIDDFDIDIHEYKYA